MREKWRIALWLLVDCVCCSRCPPHIQHWSVRLAGLFKKKRTQKWGDVLGLWSQEFESQVEYDQDTVYKCMKISKNKYSSFWFFWGCFFFYYIINFPEIQVIPLLPKTNPFLSYCSPLGWISLDRTSCTQQLMPMAIWRTAQVRRAGCLQHARRLPLIYRRGSCCQNCVTALNTIFSHCTFSVCT